MSRRRAAIVCRRCHALFPLAERNCPECGTPIRSRLGSVAVLAIGFVVLATSVSPLDALRALVGVSILVVGIAALRDRRRRVRAAKERRGAASE